MDSLEERAWLGEGQSETQLTAVPGLDGAETSNADRPAWDSKVQYVLAQLAAGQSIRQGSIGVWKHISPKLAGIGYSSCIVCFYVALYYNVIIAWSLFYLGNSFQYPLPWEHCPIDVSTNATGTDRTEKFIDSLAVDAMKECASSSPTSYFWFRKALDITNCIDESGEFNPIMTGCLLAAWAIVSLAMIKGIKGLMLDGAMDGIAYMFYPKAATQVFFALGLGYGSVIAYSSYNPVNNNCHRDALMVSGINFMTSVLASLVVFVILGFRAKNIAMRCVAENLGLLSHMGSNQHFDPWINATDPSSVSLEEYRDWFSHHSSSLGPNITDCSLEEEMNKGIEGTGLAFIAFTEVMALFPASPFWSTLFFLMLLNLGLSTMFGTMQGILTPLMDNFSLLGRHRTILTVSSCALGFVIGLLFTQRSGNYFVTMFDDYSATLPLVIVVIFETIAVSWVYGTDRFLDDIEVMLKWRPPVVYKYLWKYVCLIAMVGLLAASFMRMVFKRPTYTAWNQATGSEMTLEYPGWALGMIVMLIALASLPVPIGYIHSMWKNRTAHNPLSEEGGGQAMHRELYTKCSSTDQLESLNRDPSEEDEAPPRTAFLPLGNEHYRLLEQEEEEEDEEEQDTVV
ncbi:hypothetical protein F7725_003667 [Dissostichus mawsoni]|uniref:Uncharacterized protein n=1 Tax=Dissostichus mawsoni TaxID=36200 RepID=A0A7J5YCU6_DISMA|nr:hypothetical protein F7725_003667 [Dissostichus mawsoni]